MDKTNIFKSSNFYMGENDILHMIIIDETGTEVDIELVGVGTDGGADITEDSSEVAVVIDEREYGYLYNWYVTEDARNICADGWHIPTLTEWQQLVAYIDPLYTYSDNDAAIPLKDITKGWSTLGIEADNSLKLNIRGGGYGGGATFASIGDAGYFHTATEITDASNHRIRFAYNAARLYISYIGHVNEICTKTIGHSLRLIKDVPSVSQGEEGYYIGNDLKVYRTIGINNQEWLADSLAETKYANGDDIPEINDSTTWNSLTSGARCAYDNDTGNV